MTVTCLAVAVSLAVAIVLAVAVGFTVAARICCCLVWGGQRGSGWVPRSLCSSCCGLKKSAVVIPWLLIVLLLIGIGLLLLLVALPLLLLGSQHVLRV